MLRSELVRSKQYNRMIHFTQANCAFLQKRHSIIKEMIQWSNPLSKKRNDTVRSATPNYNKRNDTESGATPNYNTVKEMIL